ncbi:hypothetical protein QQ73_03865, partial [Candidatus Endoriftia persephone str. Guaymas]|nr:hypothetical protein [Candidatus Endoriftia persephone str. Guaymas]
YFVLPDEIGIHGEFHGQGWTKTADSDLLDLGRQPMAELEPEQRIDNFERDCCRFYPAAGGAGGLPLRAVWDVPRCLSDPY